MEPGGRALARAGRHAVKTIADALGVARSNMAVQARALAHQIGLVVLAELLEKAGEGD